MILLSALLASLTGFVAGERPAERAQVEVSAVAAIVRTGEAAIAQPVRPVPARPRATLTAEPLVSARPVLPMLNGLTRLSLKQSWLI